MPAKHDSESATFSVTTLLPDLLRIHPEIISRPRQRAMSLSPLMALDLDATERLTHAFLASRKAGVEGRIAELKADITSQEASLFRYAAEARLVRRDEVAEKLMPTKPTQTQKFPETVTVAEAMRRHNQ